MQTNEHSSSLASTSAWMGVAAAVNMHKEALQTSEASLDRSTAAERYLPSDRQAPHGMTPLYDVFSAWPIMGTGKNKLSFQESQARPGHRWQTPTLSPERNHRPPLERAGTEVRRPDLLARMQSLVESPVPATESPQHRCATQPTQPIQSDLVKFFVLTPNDGQPAPLDDLLMLVIQTPPAAPSYPIPKPQSLLESFRTKTGQPLWD